MRTAEYMDLSADTDDHWSAGSFGQELSLMEMKVKSVTENVCTLGKVLINYIYTRKQSGHTVG